MNPKDLEKEVQVLAMSFLVCTWQGHFPLPPGALVNVELPFVEYLLCIRHDTAFFFFFFCFSRWYVGFSFSNQGNKPVPPALEVWILNHWTIREVPTLLYTI